MSKLGRFKSNPGSNHWHALDQVMRYLIGTTSYEIHYAGHPTVLEGYSDSNWIFDADELYAMRRWCDIMEVLQTDHFDDVNHGSRTYCSRHSHY
jgi:hypothetical protein